MHMNPPLPLKKWMRREIIDAKKSGKRSEVNTLAALSNLSLGSKHYVDTIFDLGDTVAMSQSGRTIHFPRPLHSENNRGILCGYLEGLSAKYQIKDTFEVMSGDIVVDCGAYVGGFARSIVEIASQVILIEPAPDNFACCKKNMSPFDNATVLNCGLFNQTGTLELNMSGSDVDHSFLEPDRQATGKTINVKTLRLEALVAEQNLPRIDFFKLEAEGAEIEVIEGMGGILPRKISIDAGPERFGQSPAPELTKMLAAKGYKTEQRGFTLMAWLET